MCRTRKKCTHLNIIDSVILESLLILIIILARMISLEAGRHLKE